MTPAAAEQLSRGTQGTGLPIGLGPFDPIVREARRGLQRSLAHMIIGQSEPRQRSLREQAGGWFGPDSMTWQVHQDAAILIGGLRALMLQTMHPLAMAGVAEHSDYKHDPLARLWRTSAYVGAVTFGSTDEAEAAIRGVNFAHRKVHGVAPDGRPYSANDPELKRWVHLAMVDSFLTTYQRYGSHRLTPAQANAYLSEQAFVGSKLGVDGCPTTVDDLRAYFLDQRSTGQLLATPVARDTVKWLLRVKLSTATRAPYALLAAAAVNSLPAWVRLQLRLPILPITNRLAVRPSAAALVRVVGWAMSAPGTAGDNGTRRDSDPGKAGATVQSQ